MVNWKMIPKIDAHIHLLPDDVIEANRGYGDPFVDFGGAEDYLAVMEARGIGQAVVMPFNDPCMLSMDFAVETVHANLSAMAARAPGRLFCFADVDIRRGEDETLRELEKVCRRPEFIGIKLHPTNTGYPIDGDYYGAVFRFAVEHDLPVAVHSYPRAHLTDDTCSPRRLRRVMDKYPGLRLIVAHLGGMQYGELAGMDAYFDLSAILPELVDRLGLAGANAALRALGTGRLFFATDYPDSRSLKPDEIYERYFEILRQMDFSQEEAEQICRHNARRMLGLP